jgi:hypothetical protein
MESLFIESSLELTDLSEGCPSVAASMKEFVAETKRIM